MSSFLAPITITLHYGFHFPDWGALTCKEVAIGHILRQTPHIFGFVLLDVFHGAFRLCFILLRCVVFVVKESRSTTPGDLSRHIQSVGHEKTWYESAGSCTFGNIE